MRTRSLLPAAVAAALLAAGCGGSPDRADAPSGVPSGPSIRSVEVGGRTREYLLHRPAGLTGRAPLVVVFHGWGEGAASAEQGGGWEEAAERHGFVVALPEGVEASFNAGSCCGAAQEEGVDDVALADAVVEDVSRSAAVDPDRVYAAGFSNGGMMAYRLACESDRFAAVGSVGGAEVRRCARPRRPVSILQVHGTADDVVPLDGSRDPDGIPVPAARPVLRAWRSRLRCGAPRTTAQGDVRRTTARCPGGREVGLLTLRGAGHLWPVRSDGLDATETLWRFFARHRRNGQAP